MEHWRKSLDRWSAAGLIDAETASRITAYEAAVTPAAKLEWPVLASLIFGGIALGAGILLLVASHWSGLSPAERFGIVMAMVALLHAGGIFASDSAGFRSAFHALGTIACGAGIFLALDIFHVSSMTHGVTLWALGAAFAWWLLRDTPQTILVACLAPAAFSAEAANLFPHPFYTAWEFKWHAEWMVMTSLVYISAVLPNRASNARRALVWIGSILLLPACLSVALASETPPTALVLTGAAASFGKAWLLRREECWVNLLFVCWSITAALLPHHAGIIVFAVYGGAAAGLVWWGIGEARPERINLGIAGFALTVVCFYVTSLMDTALRSGGLIGLGILLLAGGWFLERARRHFLSRMTRPEQES